MKQLFNDYQAAVRGWDKTHHIIGQTPIEVLLKESTEALKSVSRETLPSCLVDIGAGAGMMGVAWLKLHTDNKCVFVEPRRKSLSFLHYFFGAIRPDLSSRVLILGEKIESVSRETLQRFSPAGFFSVARAFSGNKSLEEALAESQLFDDLCFVFAAELADSPKPKYVLKQIQNNQQG